MHSVIPHDPHYNTHRLEKFQELECSGRAFVPWLPGQPVPITLSLCLLLPRPRGSAYYNYNTKYKFPLFRATTKQLHNTEYTAGKLGRKRFEY
jgi:hypothetical protein